MVRSLFCSFVTALLLVAVGCVPSPRRLVDTTPETTFYIVRHAEKAMGTAPDLTEQGKVRAAFYVTFFEDVDIATVYSTDTRRTIATAAPLAAAKGLAVTEYASGLDFEAFAKTLRAQHLGESVFVVGHSNTVPLRLNALSRSGDFGDIPHDDYEQLCVVTLKGEGVGLVRQFRVPIGAATE